MADTTKLLDMLNAISSVLLNMHNSDELNNAVAESQAYVNDENISNKISNIVDNLFDNVRDSFDKACIELADLNKETVESPGELTPEILDEISAIASEFEASGDELLMKQASVLDEILLTLAAPKNAIYKYKMAEDAEVDRLREKVRSEATKKNFDDVQAELDEQNKVAETTKAIRDQVKDFRPLEAPLSTRSCPEHAGAQMSRIGDSTYQCSLDHKIYNYETGFTTMKGNKVPGGSVPNQTLYYGNREEGHQMFTTRESLNNSNS